MMNAPVSFFRVEDVEETMLISARGEPEPEGECETCGATEDVWSFAWVLPSAEVWEMVMCRPCATADV